MRLHPLSHGLVLLAFALAASPSLAAPTSVQDGPLGPAAEASDVGIYRVPISARETLLELSAEVRHERHESGDFIAELTPAQVQGLRAAGVSVVQLFPSRRAEREAPGRSLALASFTPYAQMRADFMACAASNPSIVEYVVFGQSVQGRELFGLRISGNVTVEENEPELVFWGNIHGDEFASGEVVYDFAKHLCNNYGVLPEVTGWIDSAELWLIPLANPDGHEMGTRENANGIDLNRDLGFNWDGWGGSPSPYSQPESKAIREFLQTGNVTLSTTAHCSGDVIFYPWCYSPHATPEEQLIKQVGWAYATAASYNLVNSWDDYETHGELLDLVYGDRGALCYTIEISNSVGQYPATYLRNKAGMEAICDLAGRGLSGTVTDATTGAPLFARVWIDDNPYANLTDPVLGDMHRILGEGTYDVTAWANGYLPKTISGVQVTAAGTGSFQLALEPGGNHHAMQITSVNPEDALNKHNNETDMPRAIGPPDGLALSLGNSGQIVLDFGQPGAIVDGPGVDFTIIEALVPGDAVLEAYAVYAGDTAYMQDNLIGTGVGSASFDLGASGMASTRYLRIEDQSGAPLVHPFAGLELDAVTVLNGAGGPSLSADVSQLSLATGGVQSFTLQGPTPGAVYLLLGTTAGTTVGQPLPGTHTLLPLDPSPYVQTTLTSPNTFIQGSFGFLDGQGQSTAALNVPSTLGPGLAGTTLDHGYLLLDATTLAITFVSNTVGLTLVP